MSGDPWGMVQHLVNSYAMRLDAASIEAIAQRVADLLREEPVAEFVSAAEIATRFGVSRDYIYTHAAELGAIRLSDSPKARLRFDPVKVSEILTGSKPSPPTRRGRQQRQYSKRSSVELLPVKG
jgi:hypothetical protein